MPLRVSRAGRFMAKTCTVFSPVVYCLVEKRCRNFFRDELGVKMDQKEKTRLVETSL